MNILVTGATGFIGQYLVRQLRREGHTVRCLIRDKQRAIELFDTQNLEYVIGDITDKRTLANITSNISVVYHLAAIMGHDLPSESAFRKFREVNAVGTKNIAESCIGNSVQKFIYVSSTAAMGLLKNNPIDEKTTCRPVTPYQVSKYEGELVVKRLTDEHGLPGIIMRPSMVYGVGFKGDFLTIAKVAKTGFFPKIGFRKHLSPALYVEDLVDCLSTAKEKAVVGETYITSSEVSYELGRVVRIIAEQLNLKVRMFFVPKLLALLGAWVLERTSLLRGETPLVTVRNIRSATTDRVFDIGKAKRDLCFQQKMSLEDGLKKTIEYYESVGYL